MQTIMMIDDSWTYPKYFFWDNVSEISLLALGIQIKWLSIHDLSLLCYTITFTYIFYCIFIMLKYSILQFLSNFHRNIDFRMEHNKFDTYLSDRPIPNFFVLFILSIPKSFHILMQYRLFFTPIDFLPMRFRIHGRVCTPSL